MKLSLVVLTPGKTEGKVIHVTLSLFVTAPPPVNRPTPPPPSAKAPAPAEANDDESIAAMLLSLQDDGTPGSAASPGEVPEGSTIMDMQAPANVPESTAGKEKEKDKDKDKRNTGNTSSAAKAILEKYM